MQFQSKKNGIVVDLTKAPYFADNTGKVDCTDILCRALEDVLKREIEGVEETRKKLEADPRDNFRMGFENRKMNGVVTVIFPEDPPPSRILYLPAGTYLISDTITYNFEKLKNLFGRRYCSELNRFIHFKGEGMDKTIIRLQDNNRLFRYGERRPMIDFMRGPFSNVSMMNTIEDLTLDVGAGNPGAIGLRFHSSNTGRVQNVTVRSSDPEYRGYAGIFLEYNQTNILKNIHIDGFQTGVLARNQGHSNAFEELYITHAKTGITADGPILGVLNSEIKAFGTAINVINEATVSVMHTKLEHLEGYEPGDGIRFTSSVGYLRNVESKGYKIAVVNMYDRVIWGDGVVKEYCNVKRNDPLFAEEYFELPIEPQPVYEWNGDMSIVAEVDDFGAKGDGKTDSTAAIQAAMNSGKEYVVFGEGRYLVSDEISIPASVKAINFMYCDFEATPELCESKEKGLFAITEDSDTVLCMDDGFAFEKFYGYIRFIRHGAKRDLAVSDVHIQTGAFYFNTVGGSKVYLDNVASTMGVFGGIGYGATPCFHFKDGQKVWARQFNPERSADNCLVEGCDFWCYGFKTEGPSGKGFTIHGGSRAEMICGDATIATDDGTPCVENDNSDIFVFLRTGGCGPKHQFKVAIKETQGIVTRCIEAKDMPVWHVEYYYIPAYRGTRKKPKA